MANPIVAPKGLAELEGWDGPLGLEPFESLKVVRLGAERLASGQYNLPCERRSRHSRVSVATPAGLAFSNEGER